MVQGVQDVLGGLGLGAIAGQLADLQLGELLDTPPPGLDEAVAIAKVQSIPCDCGPAPDHPTQPVSILATMIVLECAYFMYTAFDWLLHTLS